MYTENLYFQNGVSLAEFLSRRRLKTCKSLYKRIHELTQLEVLDSNESAIELKFFAKKIKQEEKELHLVIKRMNNLQIPIENIIDLDILELGRGGKMAGKKTTELIEETERIELEKFCLNKKQKFYISEIKKIKELCRIGYMPKIEAEKQLANYEEKLKQVKQELSLISKKRFKML